MANYLLSDGRIDPVEFLLRRKYPHASKGGTYSLPASLARGLPSSPSSSKFSNAVEAYRDELRAMSKEELQVLFESEIAKQQKEIAAKAEEEEGKRFYNFPNANADLSHWSKAAYWTLEEAIALSFGKEPRHVNWSMLVQFRNSSAFVEKYRKMRDLALRACAMQQISDPVYPAFYIAWAKQNGLEFNEGLAKAVEANLGALTDWKQNYEQLSELYETHKAEWEKVAAGWREAAENANRELRNAAEVLKAVRQRDEATTSADKPLGKRERESLLKIIAAMAIGGYGHDPTAVRSETVRQIVDDLQRQGLNLSDDTVRRFLKEAIEHLNEAKA
jgi:hypothetical protein